MIEKKERFEVECWKTPHEARRTGFEKGKIYACWRVKTERETWYRIYRNGDKNPILDSYDIFLFKDFQKYFIILWQNDEHS
jgi:hypothetical protein